MSVSLPAVPALRALGSIARARGATWTWFGIYVLAGCAVVEGLFGLGWHFREDLATLVLHYLFPEHWHEAVRDLVERLFAERMRTILANAGLGLGLTVVGLLLFPIKEKLSASFEAETMVDLPTGAEPPLWRQGLDETKLFLLYSAVQGVAIWMGLQGYASLAVVASLLGYWYLVLAMAIDHAAPVLQRRGWSFGGIIPSLLWRLPLSLHLVGAVFALPGVLLALALREAMATQPLLVPLLVLGVQVVGMGLATLAGCSLGAQLLRERPDPPLRLHGIPRLGAWTVLLLVLLWQAIFFGWLLRALHHKSQLLKCHYAIDWSSVEPRLRPHGSDLLKVVVHLDLDLEVHNPTAFDLAIEDLVVVVEHAGDELTRSRIDPLAVGAGSRVPIHLHLATVVTAGALVQSILQRQALDVHLEIQPPLSGVIRIPLRQ